MNNNTRICPPHRQPNLKSNVEIYPGTYAPCRSKEIDVSGQFIPSWLLIVLIVIGLLILVFAEYRAHDCIPGKKCNHSVPPPNEDDDYDIYLDKVQDMIKNNYDYVAWRQALLVAICVPLVVIFYLKGRLATFVEFLVVGLITFIVVYFSFAWIWDHFFHPNGLMIEKQLQILKDRLSKRRKPRYDLDDNIFSREFDNQLTFNFSSEPLD